MQSSIAYAEVQFDDANPKFNVSLLRALERRRHEIDPELKAAIETRAEADHTSTSEIIRAALRRFLDVA
ncbi:ribbon-helix-helix protein, CopG family [Candidatus Poriferisodalis sp.]|uniref:ribbon-helix-helix protein, CopG family n=1 Tax=Candidatus Poriferisodalis sp. TaxID=3101277 RepID=UPI003B0283A1